LTSERGSITRTRRLTMRPLEVSDRDAIARLHGHPDVWQVYGDDRAAVTRAAQRFLDRFIGKDPARGLAPWAIEPAGGLRDADGNSAGGLVGVVGLWPTAIGPPFSHRARPCIEIGWRLARPWWGQGLVTEAAATCLSQARDELGLPEVVAFTSEGNERSRAVMVRLGMIPDPGATFDHPRVPDGDLRRRHVVYRTNWAPRRVRQP
jgi:RimJ/RimL family protein N-acetyltransferase